MKKLLAALLTLSLVLALAVPAVAAEAATDVVGYSEDRIEKITDWSEIPDIMKYDDYLTNPPAYKILNADGLVKLSQIVNMGDPLEGITIYLAYDINMEGKTMDCIGRRRDFSFKGTLDGQGHVIDNLALMPTGHDETSGNIAAGLIAYGLNCTVKNVVLGSGFSVTCTNKGADIRLGGIIGNLSHCVIDNCYVLGNINGARYTGGVAGFSDTQSEDIIKNCTFGGTTTDIGRGPGGILGLAAQHNVKVINCRNTGTVTSLASSAGGWNTIAGGIVGRCWAPDLTIEGCINNGTVTGVSYAGGIIGALQLADATITDCINYGTVTATSQASDADTANGISGQVDMQFVCLETNCVDKVGQTDATLSTVPTITPVYPTQEEIDAAHGDKQEENTTAPEDNTTAPKDDETTAPAKKDDETTAKAEEVTTGAPADTEKKGCGAVFGGMAVILLTAGAALTVCKKKH